MAQRTEEEKRAARERSNANLMTPQEVNARKNPKSGERAPVKRAKRQQRPRNGVRRRARSTRPCFPVLHLIR